MPEKPPPPKTIPPKWVGNDYPPPPRSDGNRFTLFSVITIHVFCIVFFAVGYTTATEHYHRHCLAGWHEMVDGHRPAEEAARWGDWPGRNQCWHQTVDVFGWMGRVVTPEVEPNPHPEEDEP